MSVALVVMARGSSSDAPAKVVDSWVYFEKADALTVLRADSNGDVLKLTSGAADDPKNYTTLFDTELGVEAGVAFSTEAKPLNEAQIRVRLKRVKVEAAPGISTRNVKEVQVNGKGTKQNVQAVARGKVEVENYTPHKAARAIAAITFGKPRGKDDVHADAMDRFLTKNYGRPGAASKPFTKPPNVFPGASPRPALDELRKTVKASGSEGIDMVRDIGTAAQSLANEDAFERVVALVSHGFFGQSDPALSRGGNTNILESNFSQVTRVRADIAQLKRAEQKAIRDGDAPALDDIRADIAAREASPEGQFASALDEAARALASAKVHVVELQACNAGGDAGQAASPFGMKSRLAQNLSTPNNKVEVRGHAKLLATHIEEGAVFLGSTLDDASDDVAQYSKDTLPVPQP